MESLDLKGKKGIVFGVANDRSIAWAIAQVLLQSGAKLAVTYQNDRLRPRVEKLLEPYRDALMFECDVSDDSNVETMFSSVQEQYGSLDFVIHCIAFAQKEDLQGEYSATQREGFRIALEVSAYSLLPIVKNATPLMTNGGSVVTLSFLAAERVFPGYNIMGTAKAALENAVKQLAYEVGEKNVRVNAISAGPLDTLASRGIKGFLDMKGIYGERSPMRRNITHQEVANTALFLCSDLSTGITGTVLHVDAGYHIMAV